MITDLTAFLKAFFFDPTAFRRYARGGLMGVWSLYQMGVLPAFLTGSKLWWYVAQLMPVVAVLIGAGEKNRPPGEIKGIAQDLTIEAVPPKK